MFSGGYSRVGGEKRRRGGCFEKGYVETVHVAVGMVPFGAAVDGVEVAGRAENEVASVGAEHG